MKRGQRGLAVLFSILVPGFLGAQGWEGGQEMLPVPPTALARQAEFSAGILAKLPVERLRPQTVKHPSGVTITVREARPGEGENKLWELRWDPGQPWGAGTWVAFRDGLGQLRETRIILLEGTDGTDHQVVQPGTWIRLVPQGLGRGCRLDVFLAGRLVTGGWTVPASLVEVMDSDDTWLWASTANDVDWGALLPSHRWEDEKVEALQTRMHKLLSNVPSEPLTLWWPDPRSSVQGTAANGSPWGGWALLPGQEGHAVRGLGSWGVTLWAATGVLRGWKGGFPTWDALLEPRVELPGYSRALVPADLTSDPAFALDWIRNLGLEVYRTLYPHRPLANDSADVKELPFLDPLPGTGYALDDFPAVLHLLAVSRPGQAYLVSRSVQQVEKGTSSAVVFREPALLLPWVGKDNRVRAAVYAGPQEQTWQQWVSQLPSGRRGIRPDYVALVALPLPPTVELPVLPAR